jgi:hypothetical protein
MSWTLAAAAAQVLLGTYLTVTDQLPLFPWNDLASVTLRERVLRLVLNSAPHFLFAWTFVRGILPAMLAAMLFYVITLAMHVDYWWRPYLVGATEGERWRYERRHARTHRFLPPRGDHPVPDGHHTVAAVLLSLTLVLTVAGAFSAL